jgi:hypothetical protein
MQTDTAFEKLSRCTPPSITRLTATEMIYAETTSRKQG